MTLISYKHTKNIPLPLFLTLSLCIGSCVSGGYTGCCESGDCRGGDLSNCYCDELCHRIGDCCDDILTISCPVPGRVSHFAITGVQVLIILLCVTPL